MSAKFSLYVKVPDSPLSSKDCQGQLLVDMEDRTGCRDQLANGDEYAMHYVHVQHIMINIEGRRQEGIQRREECLEEL